ncbi:hypothetical protein WA1_02490 [Scytonema hofmannii PCC 7110]|uniref:Uncharacterized protein n=1 Tax=Scytonema hofmannii PCC 7110 TaxID=128403 RepID=A0A139XH77_9CYAN|nr:hypothetical protein [Scytonema hofmannii]KYC44031.1 hypothetical protein WA1_02490 [Scytonema hofmannii PCC 7110]
MGRESVGDQEALREMLHFFLEKMGATQVELSEGMGVSRPVVIDFLNKEKERLPVDREGLIQLCKNLRSRRASKRKLKRECEKTSEKEKVESNPDELRKLLGDTGADELLESAGFLPEKTKIIRVSSERFFQVAQIAALLELLEFEDLCSTTQEFVAIASNKVAIAGNKLFWNSSDTQENDSLGYLIEKLRKSYPTLGLKLRLEVIEKLGRTWERLKAGGKTNFSRQEAIALFLSITIKEQMLKYPTNLQIRVQKLEFKTLSRTINREKEYSDLYDKFVQISHQAECELKTSGICSTIQLEAQSLNSLNPVIMAIVTCSFSHDGKSYEFLEWMYTSSNTIVENAIGACSLHMGLTEEIANVTLSTKTLDSSIDSLVKTTVVLGNQQQYQGIWVDRDSMITMLQAIVCAAKQWLAEQSWNGELNLEIYGSVCKTLSDLRTRLTNVRMAFQNFQFLDEECRSAQIKRIADIARDELKKIPKEKIYFSYRLNFYRCYFLAKRLELRLSNFQGNISNAKLLIQTIKEDLEEDCSVKKNLVPIQALIQSEIYLYELSCGHNPDLFEFSKRKKWLGLEEWDNEIRKAIKPGSCYKDPGLDVYQALSEIYGNAARIQLYLANDKNSLEEAAVHFLRAAHYASRIGLTQRMARWLALAGRVWVRLGDGNLSRQALSFAEKFAKADLTTGHSPNFCQAVLSEISLLNGEYLLLIQDEPIQALESFLKALKGSVYLGLNRRICDALFNIARCSKKLGNFSIKEGLGRVFQEGLTESSKSKLNQMSNHTSEKVLDLLYSLWSGEENPTWFQVRGEFSKLAAQTWQGWHDDTSKPGMTTKHPIAEQIESESWLCQIN